MSWQIQISNEICPHTDSGCYECWNMDNPGRADAVKKGGLPLCNEKDCPMKIEQTDTVDQDYDGGDRPPY